MKKIWYIYILECSDGTFYIGITNDLDKRIKAHNEGKGARYTKGRGPVKLVHSCIKQNRSQATKLELSLKKMSREKKLKFINFWTKDKLQFAEVIDILKKHGWTTEGENIPQADSSNNSTYMLWKKKKAKVFLGNYFVELEGCGSGFPWANPGVTEKEVVAFLNGDNKTAFAKIHG